MSEAAKRAGRAQEAMRRRGGAKRAASTGAPTARFEQAFEKIYRLVLRIPRGRVMTYGQIARLLEERYSPRLVGWAMHATPKDDRNIPWHRVINSRGGISTGRVILTEPDLQRLMLEAEGVVFDKSGHCDLSTYQWSPRQRAARARLKALRGKKPAGAGKRRLRRARLERTAGRIRGEPEKDRRMEITPERLRLIREKFETNHFPRSLGIELDWIEPGRAQLSLDVKQRHLQLAGIMHGGAIATLIDTAVAFAIVGASEPNARFTTIEMKVNYLSAIREGRITAEARLIRDGRRIVVAECDLFDSKGQLAAKGLLTYMRLDERT